MKVLDLPGLTKFWEGLKTYLSNKYASKLDLVELATKEELKNIRVIRKVTALPTDNISENRIYLVGEKAYIYTGTKWLEISQDLLTFDETPTDNSDNPVKSKGIKAYVDTNVANILATIKNAEEHGY